MKSPETDVSVVLPALNEEETIADCINRINEVFSTLDITGEIIIADSSTDHTAHIAESLGARVIHPEKMGYGNAYLAGFSVAKGKYIAIGDADNTYDFLELPKLLEKIDEGADLVMGSRLRGEIRDGAMRPLHRYIGNPLLTRLLNLLFGTTISDTHSGFRVIRKEALDTLHLKTGGMEFASEMLIEAAQEGLRIEEVPITYSPRIAPSKLNSVQDGWRHIRFMLLYKPIPFIAVPGLFFAIFGFAMMVFFLLKGDIETSRLHSFILAAIALVGGLQILLMGVMIAVYSTVHGYSRKSRFIGKLMNYYNLERELFMGILLMITGIAVGLWIVWEWVAAGFGELFLISYAVLSLALFLSGMEILFSAIFISMMMLNYENGADE